MTRKQFVLRFLAFGYAFGIVVEPVCSRRSHAEAWLSLRVSDGRSAQPFQGLVGVHQRLV